MNCRQNKVDVIAMKCLEMGEQGNQIADRRGISWIRPQMMQRVLSSIALSHENSAAQFPSQMELLNLFPESTIPSEHETIESGYPPLSNGVTKSRSVSGSSWEKKSSAELMILYNGAVKACNVSAEEAEEELKNVRKGLPMAKKLSLQRFLQKRKERVGSLNPYNNRMSKVGAKEDEEEYLQIGLSLSFPSQRSG